jgi:hypothetical protein
MFEYLLYLAGEDIAGSLPLSVTKCIQTSNSGQALLCVQAIVLSCLLAVGLQFQSTALF